MRILKIFPFLFFFCLQAAEFSAAEPPSASAAAASVQTYEQLVSAIRQTRAATQQAMEQAKVRESWEIGKLIVAHIFLHKERADYGHQVIARLAKDLESSERELNYAAAFYRAYPIPPTSAELTWSDYRELLSLSDAKKRDEIARQAEKEKWDVKRIRSEVVKVNADAGKKSSPQSEKLTANPGVVGLYRLVIAPGGPYKGDLVLDLGFSNYFKFGNMSEFKAGQLVFASPVKQSKKGLAAQYRFSQVYPKGFQETVHLVPGSPYVVADETALYTYPAYVTEVVDGDTVKAVIDLGFGFFTEQKLRFRGLDAPELESSGGRDAKEFLEKELGFKSSAQDLPPVTIKTVKSDKYDRYLVDMWLGNQYINQRLLDESLAVRVQE